ncbi:MAG: DUF4340 domain-containing protein [Clostridia bacterium]|nr:DUF4340 domain-containing protein [Clostridia bacterium]
MKPIKNIIIILAIIAVLATAFVVLLKTEPKEELEATPSFEPITTVDMFKTEKENIKSITITKDGKSYTVATEGEKWIVNNDPTIKISQSKANTLAYECSSVTAKELIAENVTDFSPYGLDNPTAVVDILFKDNTTQGILIGNKTADGSLSYLMLSGDNKVYAKSQSGVESLALSLDKLRDASLYSIAEEDIAAITIEKSGSNKIVLERNELPTNEGEEKVYEWKMKSPVIKNANEYNLFDYVVPTILSLSFDSVAEDDPQNLAPYGLDNPYAVYTVSDSENSYTISVGKETENGRYVKSADGAAVYVIENSKLKFLEYNYMQLVDKLIHLENIEDVSKVTVNGNGKNYEMTIEGEKDNASYKINSVPVSEDSFKNVYQAVIGIMFDDFTASTAAAGETDCTVTYHKKSGEKTVVTYNNWDERNYLVRINGEGSLICRKKQITSMLDKLNQTVSE